MFEEVKKALGANWFRAFVVAFGCLWVWHSFFSTVAEVGQSRNVSAQAENAAPREKAIAQGAVADAEIKEATAREALARQKAERESAEAEAQIREATAREALARQIAERKSAEAEAKIREATALETLRRQKAEADEAQARAIKTKAEGCSARAKANAENMRIDMSKMQQAFSNGTLMADPTVGVERHFDLELMRDCDPAHSNMRSVTGNLRDAPCFRELQTIFDKLPLELAKVELVLEPKLAEWKKSCQFVDDEEIAMFNTIFEAWTKKPGLIPSTPSSAPSSRISAKPPAAPAPTRTIESTPAVAAVSPAPDDPDIEAARRYRVAADRGDAEGQFNLGNMYEAGRGGLSSDPEEAARLYKLSADQGYAQAQVRLAALYELGKGAPKNLPESAKYYRLAADQGSAAGQSNLADAYEKGAGVPKNLCEAKRLRLLAAAQGEAHAIKNLNEMRVPSRCKNTIAAR